MDLNTTELREKAFHWCTKYLGGSWASCSLDQFKFSTYPGGLTNYLYCCELDHTVEVEDHERRKVMLRIYGEISGPHEKFSELLVFSLLSAAKRGPRLLGAFSKGRFEEYIESRTVTVHELRKCTFLPQIASMMARFHIMEMPLGKKPKYIRRNASRWLPYVEKAFTELCSFKGRNREIVEECIRMNVLHEFDNLLKALTCVPSAVVFCHNDVQECNLLLPIKEENAASLTDRSELILIDYEYSNYGHRGHDIGNHFCEWVFQNISDRPLGFDYDFDKYPDTAQQMQFARIYLDTQERELRNDPESRKKRFTTTPEDLLYEANAYSLLSHLFWGIWGFAQNYLSHIDFNFLEYSLIRFRAYFHFKDRFYPATVPPTTTDQKNPQLKS